MARFKSRLRILIAEESLKRGKPFTQAQLAKATGLSVPTITRWVAGDMERIERDTVSRLMKFFGCSFEDLVVVEPDEQ